VATIVDDAKRHGVDMQPIDVLRSEWDCCLEGQAVRMGFRFVKTLGKKDGERIAAARAEAPFTSLDDIARRTGLDEGALAALARAGAFESLGADRRPALWDVPRVAVEARSPLPLEMAEEMPAFPPLDDFQRITWDYRAASHSTQAHPLAPLREALRAQRLPDARTIGQMPHGRRARYAGIVICRQRPGTASGVTFMTLEDETGFVNVVIWTQVFEEFVVLAKTASFLGVSGKIQSQDGVVHLVAEELWAPRLHVEPESAGSRDFH
jgi:error-prone DNA polymerase